MIVHKCIINMHYAHVLLIIENKKYPSFTKILNSCKSFQQVIVIMQYVRFYVTSSIDTVITENFRQKQGM